MKRLTTIVLMFFAGTAFGQGTVAYRTFFSEHLNQTRSLNVYLPQGYDPSGTTRYPVIYFLHGWGGNQASYWYVLRPTLDALIGSGAIEPVIMVTPNGDAAPYNGSMWTNSALYGPFEDYVTEDVVSFIDSSYLTKAWPNARSLLGHSMGAIGAMTIGLSHPEVFGALAAHSGYFNWDRAREDLRDAVLAENTGPPYDFQYGGVTYTSLMFLFAGGYSPNLENPPWYVDYPFDQQGDVVEDVINRWVAHNPDVLASALPPVAYPDIFFDCGDQDDLFNFVTNLDLAAAFDAMGVPYQFRPFQGGHDLTAERLEFSLAFLDEAMHALTSVRDSALTQGVVLELYSSQPNPVGESTDIRFLAPSSGHAILRVYDVRGCLLETLLNGDVSAGEHILQWRPRQVAAGIYLLELTSAGHRATQKIMVSH